MRRPPQWIQIAGSVLVAIAIVAIAIAVVTAHFGPTSSVELEAREERVEERLELREEMLEERRER
jgi:type II secretory pathway pseudopilin PulG